MVRIITELFEKTVDVRLANRFAGHETLGEFLKRQRPLQLEQVERQRYANHESNPNNWCHK